MRKIKILQSKIGGCIALLLVMAFILFFFTQKAYTVTKYKGIQPGLSTQEEVSDVLGAPTQKIDDSAYEYGPNTGIDKYIIEYSQDQEGKTVVDRLDMYLSKPVTRKALAGQMKLPDKADKDGTSSTGKLVEFYGGKKSLVLTYQGEAEKSGVKMVSFLSRNRFEEGPGEPITARIPTPVEEEEERETPPVVVGKPSIEAKIHLQQGMTYVTLAQANPKKKKENYKNAELEFTQAIELYPKYAEAYSNRGVIYMQQKKYNKSEIDLLKAADINPKDPYVQYNLAALYSLQKKTDLGLDAMDKALELGFNNYDALRPRGKGSDPDLKNLRKDPGYKQVLEKHKVFILK